MIKKEYVPIVLWVLWIFAGTLWYSLYEGHPASVALYQSTSVGWALGWSLPSDTQRTYDDVSLGYSCIHNSIGVMFTGLAVIYIAEKMTRSNENWMLQVARKRNIKNEQAGAGVVRRVMKWLKLNRDKAKVIALTCCCFLFGVLFGLLSLGQNLSEAMELTLSTLTTCGYQGLPASASHWQYVIISLYTNLAVPIFTISLGTLVSIFIENPEDRDFYTKVAAPLTETELKFMTSFGIGNDTGFVDLKEYIILTIVRIGSIQPDVIVKIKDKYRTLLKSLDDAGDGMIPYDKLIHDDHHDDMGGTAGAQLFLRHCCCCCSHLLPDSGGRLVQRLCERFHLDINFADFCGPGGRAARVASDDNMSGDKHKEKNGVACDATPSISKTPPVKKKMVRNTILRALGRTSEIGKGALYMQSAQRKRTPSISLGSHKPRRLSVRGEGGLHSGGVRTQVRTSPSSPSATPAAEAVPTKADKLAAINRNFKSSRIVPFTVAPSSWPLDSNGPPARLESGMADDVQTFDIDTLHRTTEESGGDTSGIMNNTKKINSSTTAFPNEGVSSSCSSSNSLTTEEKKAAVPVQTFKNVSISDMFCNIEEGDDYSDDDDDDDDDKSECSHALGKIIDSSTLTPRSKHQDATTSIYNGDDDDKCNNSEELCANIGGQCKDGNCFHCLSSTQKIPLMSASSDEQAQSSRGNILSSPSPAYAPSPGQVPVSSLPINTFKPVSISAMLAADKKLGAADAGADAGADINRTWDNNQEEQKQEQVNMEQNLKQELQNEDTQPPPSLTAHRLAPRGPSGASGGKSDSCSVVAPERGMGRGGLASLGKSFKNSVRDLAVHVAPRTRSNNIVRKNLRLSTVQRLDKISRAHRVLLKRKNSADLLRKGDYLRGLLSSLVLLLKEDNKVHALLVWVTWLTLAALFYTFKMQITIQKGFFISVNVGYAVYWDTFDTDAIERCFSVLHLLAGQLFLSFALATFARMLIGNKANWYLEALHLRDLETKRLNQTALDNFYDSVLFYSKKVKAFSYFLLFLCFGVLFSCMSSHWSFPNGLYYAVTCMSTGGLWGLPDDASDDALLVTALFTAIGAPVMMITFGTIAQVVNSLSSSSALNQELARPMTALELEFMQFEVIEDTDGFIDASEFTLLMLVRLKALNPELISTIIQRFTILDVEGVGEISYDDVTAEVDMHAMDGDGEGEGSGGDKVYGDLHDMFA